jgi:hypothetical protein
VRWDRSITSNTDPSVIEYMLGTMTRDVTIATGTRRAVAGVVLAALVVGCAVPSSATPPAEASTASPTTTVSVTSDPRFAEVDAAQAKWVARQPSGYAFTFTHVGPSGLGPSWRYRVTSFDGQVQVQALDGWDGSRDDLARISMDGLFETARQGIAFGDTVVAFDPDLGYPIEISQAPEPSIADGDWSETATEFMTVTRDADRAALTREVARTARAAWVRWQPSAYAYSWQRFGTTGPRSGTAWHVRYTDGQASIDPDPASDGALPSTAAEVGPTFDAIEAALDAGAWVDLTIDHVNGLPLLAAIDPSPDVSGDGYWIRIDFQDIADEEAKIAVRAAADRWAAAALKRFSYTWRYRGDLDPLTYGMTLDGDVATVRPSPGTPGPEAASYATPRINETLRMIETVLVDGGHVVATYDARLGYPVRVTIDPASDAGPPGTITITDFVVH